MLKLFALGILLAVAAPAADIPSEAAAIDKTIDRLNAFPGADVFTSDFDDWAALKTARAGGSHVECPEVWQETCGIFPIPGLDARRIVAIKIQFVTADVAIADAVGNVPVLIVLKKESAEWKVALIRVLPAD